MFNRDGDGRDTHGNGHDLPRPDGGPGGNDDDYDSLYDDADSVGSGRDDGTELVQRRSWTYKRGLDRASSEKRTPSSSCR